jgi:hypothetical protein
MKYLLKRLTLLNLLLLPLTATGFAQNRWNLYFEAGSGNVRKVVSDQNHDVLDKFNSIPSFKLGLDYSLKLKDKWELYPVTGLSITDRGTKYAYSDGSFSHTGRFYSLDAPLLVKWDFEKWLSLRCGLTGSCIIGNTYFKDKDIWAVHRFTYSATAGLSTEIKKITIRADVIWGKSDLFEIDNFGVSFREKIILFGIGYRFEQLKLIHRSKK